jgi:hypothetical protein
MKREVFDMDEWGGFDPIPRQVLTESAEKGDQAHTIIWENMDGAVVGHARVWRDDAFRDVLVYSYKRLINEVRKASGPDGDWDEAEEYVQFNMVNAYLGPYTPLVVDNWI